MANEISQFQDRLGYRFRNSAHLLEALTHRSFVAENDSQVPDNQRLEFLGDAVIQIVLTKRIYASFPDRPEGDMTKMRAILARQETLARLARLIDLGVCLRLGHGEELSQGAARPSNLCDAFEAVLGAVYLDSGGLAAPEQILNGLLDKSFAHLEYLLDEHNPKGALQEWSQRALQLKPEYRLLDAAGPDHEREYTVAVVFGDDIYGTGVGRKRQAAEAAAAQAALDRIRREQKQDEESPECPP